LRYRLGKRVIFISEIYADDGEESEQKRDVGSFHNKYDDN